DARRAICRRAAHHVCSTDDDLVAAIAGSLMIPLEDNAGDIVRKAQRGLGLPGESDPTKLGLNAEVLSKLAHWTPVERSLTGLAMFTTPYGDMTVNSYVITDGKVAAAFDTGADCSEMMKHQIQQIFLTHAHGDHVMDLPRLKRATRALAFI